MLSFLSLLLGPVPYLPSTSTARRTFHWVFVFSHVLEHGWDHLLVAFCSSPRAGGDALPHVGLTFYDPLPGVGSYGPPEGVPSTAARVAMEMRAAV